MFKFLADFFKPKNDLSKIYPAAFLPKNRDGLAAYPNKDFLDAQGVYAYRLQFMTTLSDADKVFGVIASSFHLQNKGTYQEGEAKGNDGTTIHFSIRQEFTGAVIESVTNNVPFLLSLDKLELEPPAPWCVFPDVDPETLGGRQGSIDYWWTWYWSPFWDSETKEQKQRFLEKNNVSAEWADYFDSEFT